MKKNPFDTPEFKKTWEYLQRKVEEDFDPKDYDMKVKPYNKLYEAEVKQVLKLLTTPEFIAANESNKPLEELSFEIRGWKVMGIAK